MGDQEHRMKENRNMGSILAADDLAPQMFVAVHSPRRPSGVVRRAGPRGIEVHEEPLASPVPPGVPLQVMASSLPFVVCSVLEPGGNLDGPVILDLRAVRLTRLTREFVTAVAAFKVPPPTDALEETPECEDIDEVSELL